MQLTQLITRPNIPHATTNTTMQLSQPIISVGMRMPTPTYACSWINTTPTLDYKCHSQHTHAAGATSRQLGTAHSTTITTMQPAQHITSSGLHMPPPTSTCSWINLSPTPDCTYHHQHTRAAGATSRQLWTAHATLNTIMQLEQPLASYVLHMPQPTQSSSCSNLSPAMYCSYHHQHNHAAGPTTHQPCTATTNTTKQLEQHITSSGLHMPPPPT